jgi:hypothetical protein
MLARLGEFEEISPVVAFEIGGQHLAALPRLSTMGHFSCRFTKSSRTDRLGVRFQPAQSFSHYCAIAADRVGRPRRVERLEERFLPALSYVTRRIDSASEERSRLRVELMARVQDGDTESCRALLDDIGPMLANFLRRRIADREELEDVYQETLMAFFQLAIPTNHQGPLNRGSSRSPETSQRIMRATIGRGRVWSN